jgi:pimeloyl-ACP methyl ester carboxylesterase
MKRNLCLIFITGLTFLYSCDEETNSTIVPEKLIEKELVVSLSSDQLISFVQDSRLPIPINELKYDVDVYKVTYRTSYKDEEVIASGLIAIPNSSKDCTILSFQHGTIASHAEAPSETPSDAFVMKFYAAMAGIGLVAVVPDFIGFGSSKDVLHPYYVETATADAVLDNIIAAKELALLDGKKLTNRLLLAGYSQGGYATMAAHKAIEQEGGKIDGLQLVASFPSSGGYDVKGMQEYFFGLETYDQPFFLAYVALAYKQTYDWEMDLNIFFKEPFASKLESLFDGTKSGNAINEELTMIIEDYVQSDLLLNIDTKPEYAFIVDAFNKNSLTNWTPTIPVYMYHGDADITVPYNNSVSTYEQFLANGAKSSVVSFTPLPFATHSTGVTPYIIEFINKALALK